MNKEKKTFTVEELANALLDLEIAKQQENYKIQQQDSFKEFLLTGKAKLKLFDDLNKSNEE